MSETANPITEFHIAAFLNRCSYRLFDASISVSGSSWFVQEYEAQIPLALLRPDYAKIRYLRQSCYHAAGLSLILGVILVVLLYPLGKDMDSVGVITAAILLILSLLSTILQSSLVTAYKFYARSGHVMLTIKGIGRHCFECDNFVERVATQICSARRTKKLPAMASSSSDKLALALDKNMLDLTRAIATYAWSGVLDYGECRVNESAISLRRGRRLCYEAELSIALCNLLPSYSVIHYRRLTFTWGTLSTAVVALFWWTAATGRPLNLPLTFSMVLLMIMSLSFAVSQFPLVKVFHFFYRSGAYAFSVFALGRQRLRCECFVRQVTHRIHIVENLQEKLAQATKDEKGEGGER